MKIKFFISLIVIAAIVWPLSSFLIPTFGNVSEGERAGIVQKATSKGMFVKTNEGELALEGIKTGAQTSVSSVFDFSVKDQTVMDSLNAYMGKRVKVWYKEYWHVNTFDGETDYIVWKVEQIK